MILCDDFVTDSQLLRELKPMVEPAIYPAPLAFLSV
jgi:hypothetical protein